MAPFLAKTIISQAKGETLNDPLPKKMPVLAAISLGPVYGILVLNENVMHGEGHGASKFTYTETYINMYRGDISGLPGNKAYMEDTYKKLTAGF